MLFGGEWNSGGTQLVIFEMAALLALWASGGITLIIDMELEIVFILVGILIFMGLTFAIVMF